MPGAAEFEILVREHAPRLLAFARAMLGEEHEAEDVVQEAFAKAWMRWDDADLRDHALPWLLRVVRNRCIDIGRVHVPKVGFERLPDSPAPAPTDEPPARAFTLDKIIDGIRRLDEPYRTVLLLRYSQKLSYEDIAATTGVPLGTVKSQISRAVRLLREVLS